MATGVMTNVADPLVNAEQRTRTWVQPAMLARQPSLVVPDNAREDSCVIVLARFISNDTQLVPSVDTSKTTVPTSVLPDVEIKTPSYWLSEVTVTACETAVIVPLVGVSELKLEDTT